MHKLMYIILCNIHMLHSQHQAPLVTNHCHIRSFPQGANRHQPRLRQLEKLHACCESWTWSPRSRWSNHWNDQQKYGDFHSHGGYPIAGWFLWGKILPKNRWWLGVALWRNGNQKNAGKLSPWFGGSPKFSGSSSQGRNFRWGTLCTKSWGF